MLKERYIILHLSLIDKVGPATIEKLVQTLLNKSVNLFDSIYKFSKKDLMYYGEVSEQVAQRITQGLLNKSLLEKELSLIQKFKIKLVTILDPEYPVLLKDIHLPPSVIYIKSNNSSFNFTNKAIAIVGSRKSDDYGAKIINLIIPELVKQNWLLISGGAYGIDTLVHKASIYYTGNTVAVLGSGLLKPYPAQNAKLFEEISEQYGAVISPFSLNTSALPGNFPARNRIISGLSKATLVVQANQKSGALITAQFALEQGREVCAVPGNIDNSLSAGCNKLISQGATLVTTAQDIFSALGQIQPEINTLNINTKQDLIKQNLKLNLNSQKVLSYCTKPISFDELLLKTGFTCDELQDILFNLQLESYVNQDFTGFWQALS